MRDTHRSTQRAPLSCTTCASRKVRCSRTIPCQACLSRGTAADCRREVVVVRGHVRTADTPGSSPSIAELLLENTRLSALVEGSHPAERSNARAIDLTEYYEKRLYAAVGQVCQSRSVATSLDVAMPSLQCSRIFVDFADTWVSWVHFACFFPEFREQHEHFWSAGGLVSTSDPLWLSLYFAILASGLVFMSDDDFGQSEAPLESRSELTWNWYSAALFYLDQGDFLQNTNLRVVQTIVVLGNVASTIGETHRHANLWAVAVRAAQQLNLGCDELNLSENLLQQETRRRLWWTLVICEWLPIPLRTPCVSGLDFSCRLPLVIGDARLADPNHVTARFLEQEPCPVQYHIVMAKIATIYHQLHAKLRLRTWSPTGVADFVIQADDQLAEEIEHLPHHLQHNNNNHSEVQQSLEKRLPWIATQRTSLVIVLLYYRLAINRVLQVYWLEGSTNFARSRSVCLSSAVGLIHSATSSQGQFSRLRSWDFAMIVFSATTTLALEIRRSTDNDPRFIEAISSSMHILERVKAQNKLAKEALCILNELTMN